MEKKQRYDQSYVILNIVFAVIIVVILVYSAMFTPKSGGHPIKSACMEYTGKPCKSTGLTRSFAYIMRGNFEEARKMNKNGIGVFLFFAITLVLRVLSMYLSVYHNQYEKKWKRFDISFTIIFFLYSFRNFLDFWNLN